MNASRECIAGHLISWDENYFRQRWGSGKAFLTQVTFDPETTKSQGGGHVLSLASRICLTTFRHVSMSKCDTT